MKEPGRLHWFGANPGATKNIDCIGLPAGARYRAYRHFANIGMKIYCWRSTPHRGGDQSQEDYLIFYIPDNKEADVLNVIGISARCVTH